MTEIKYSLSDFNNIRLSGFDYVLDENVIKIISELALQVGSPDYIKTPNFSKKEQLTHVKELAKKKRGNKNVEGDDWELIRNFQTTNIEEKLSAVRNIDNIRANLNKLTDKNAIEIKNKIINDIDKILEDNKTALELNDIITTLFDIASLNRFYSEIYAEWKQLVNTSINGVFDSRRHPIYIASASKNAANNFTAIDGKPDIGSTEVFNLANAIIPLVGAKLEKVFKEIEK